LLLYFIVGAINSILLLQPTCMTLFFHIPATPLNQFIAGFTYYKGFKPIHTIDRYLPNGNIEIIIDLTVKPKYIYDNATLQPKQVCKNLWVSGMRSNYITIPSGLNAEMLIIEFKKGMAYPFLGMPLTEITEQVVDGDLALPAIFTHLRERLLQLPSAKEMFAVTEDLLLKQFGNRVVVNPIVGFAVSNILACPSSVTIKNIAAKTGYSPKHFIKIFADNVGVTPKLFARIIRFQKAIAEIETLGCTNLAALAYECGYYDQAHFIADFKNFAGFTPLEYMRTKSGPYINYVPVG